MTIKQAINVMKKYTDPSISQVVVEAHEMAIDALSRLQPTQVNTDGNLAFCPTCNAHIDYAGNIAIDIKDGKKQFCNSCGQAVAEDMCVICKYNTNRTVCHPHCSGCDGFSKWVAENGDEQPETDRS